MDAQTQQFHGMYYGTIINHANDNKRWSKEHLEMLDVCTKTNEGIRQMIKYFERKGKAIRSMQRKRARKRLDFLRLMEKEAELQDNKTLLSSIRGEMKMLKEFLNCD